MKTKLKNIIVASLCGIWVFGLSLWGIFSPDKDISLSERRSLAKMPELSTETVSDGSFMSHFEKYSADQFPLRESFRRIKSIGEYYLFRQLDSNNIYLHDGYASQLEYPLKESSVETAASRFEYIYDKYLKDNGGSVYLSVIPDKNYFLAEDGGYPHIDFDKMITSLREKTKFAEYIDIIPTLEISDYYRTDTHWRQEKLTETAAKLAEGLGVELSLEYEQKKIDVPFYGVYYGQSALPLAGEDMYYLWNDLFDDVTVYNYEAQGYTPVYDLEKAEGADPYEIYLSGPRSLMVIENPNADTERELIIFRDSYGSSIAPLLIEAYSKITMVDIRYLPSPMLKNLVDFENADALFLYSTLVLNNSETFK